MAATSSLLIVLVPASVMFLLAGRTAALIIALIGIGTVVLVGTLVWRTSTARAPKPCAPPESAP